LGDRPVLLLLGIRLGLDGVNPIYSLSQKVTGNAFIVIDYVH
jgi:hypothetical protein